MDTPMESTMPTTETVAECTDCAAHVAEQRKNEDASIAFLLALLPVMVLTFFGQVGLL